jgi:signal transduction histidine kinase
LPEGKYHFQVIACNSAGVWNESGASFSFAVQPFWWQRLWFRFTALFVFVLLIAAVVRYISFRRLKFALRKLEQETALQKERARIAQDIHDDLGASLTQISLLGELSRQHHAQPEKVGQHVERIATMARHGLKSLDEIVWAVNPRNDTLSHLFDYAGQYAIDFLGAAGIRCVVEFPDEWPSRTLPAHVRHGLFLAVKEAMNNIVKHSGATEVKFQAQASSGVLKIKIEDNGCGFAQAPDDALADGLRNMRQRVSEIGGAFVIESAPGNGTKVSVEIPLS